MKLEDQVVSLELSKRLKELGVKQESEFYWQDVCDTSLIHIARHQFIDRNRAVSAFTVAELGEMLPTWGENDSYWKLPWSVRDSNGVKWYTDISKGKGEVTEADARAKILIHLIEQKVVKP